ncbi:MAG: glutamate ABC transporter substrate-binding protein, partial [Microbacterium aurantiacum]
MKRTRIPLIALAAVSALALSACAGGTDDAGGDTSAPPVEEVTFEEGTTMAELADAGTITIGTKFDQPLFGLMGPSGTPEGFDVEIGKIIAAQLGISEDNIEWVETVSANREPFIENGQVDIVIATYTINDTRKEVVSFAGPYYMAGQSILVLADNEDIQSEEDLVGQPVCSVTGSTPAENLAELGAEPVLTDTYSNCLEPLRTGAVVAVSTDNVILAGLAAQNEGEFKVVGEPFTDE